MSPTMHFSSDLNRLTGKRTHKLLRGFLEQQLTVMMQMRINLHVGVVQAPPQIREGPLFSD